MDVIVSMPGFGCSLRKISYADGLTSKLWMERSILWRQENRAVKVAIEKLYGKEVADVARTHEEAWRDG